MDKINFQNGVTKVNADTFNTFQNNVEKSAVVVSTTQPTTNEKVWFKKGKNLFAKDTIFKGHIDTSTQKIVLDDEEYYIGYARISPNTAYTVSKQAGKSFRIATTSQTGVGQSYNITQANHTGTTITFTSGANDKYVYIFFYATTNGDTGGYSAMANSIQVEQGSTATTYEAYIEPKLYVKNNNGVYEEFVEEMQGAGNILVNTSEITINEFCKRNKVCTLSVEMKLAQDLSANAPVKIMSGLPKTAISGKFVAVYGANKVCKINLTKDALYLWYNSTAITSGDYLSIYVTYTTN